MMPRIAACVLLIGWLGAVAAFEWAAWDWHPAREEPPGASLWHWMRAGVTAMLGVLLVAAFARSRPARREPLSAPVTAVSAGVLALTLALTALLALDPSAYHRLIEEDGAVEWGSALLLLLASGFALLWLAALARAPERQPIDMLAAGGFAGLFFVMAMEEISWFQRVIGFDTPEAVAQRNWQGEFNLHNFQTDLTELALYSGTGVFLVVLPLLRESLARVRPFDQLVHLLPDRAVAAVSAPMLMLTYGHFSLLPVQAATWLGIAVMALFAIDARAAQRGSEAMLFAALAAGVALGQAVYLAIGGRMVEIFDATEYREAIIALGLAFYAARQWQAARTVQVPLAAH